jgi:hypothetical protein
MPIRPFHTLLLLEEPGELTRGLPVDASPQLRALIALADPVKGFDDLQACPRTLCVCTLRTHSESNPVRPPPPPPLSVVRTYIVVALVARVAFLDICAAP